MLSKPRPWPDGIMEKKRREGLQREDMEFTGSSLSVPDFSLEKEFKNSAMIQGWEKSLYSLFGVLGRGHHVEEQCFNLLEPAKEQCTEWPKRDAAFLGLLS